MDFDSFLPDFDFLSINIKLERSNVDVSVINMPFIGCGLRSPNSTFIYMNSRIKQHRMGIGITPINLSVYKGFKFRIGTELSKTFNSYEVDLDRLDFNDGNFIDIDDTVDNNVNSIGVGMTLEMQFGEF